MPKNPPHPPKKNHPNKPNKKTQNYQTLLFSKEATPLLQKQKYGPDSPVTIRMTFWLEGYLMCLVYLLRY